MYGTDSEVFFTVQKFQEPPLHEASVKNKLTDLIILKQKWDKRQAQS